MTRDQALIIADRIMRRIEGDKAIHRDSLADELVMGMAINQLPQVSNKASDFFDGWTAEEINRVTGKKHMGVR